MDIAEIVEILSDFSNLGAEELADEVTACANEISKSLKHKLIFVLKFKFRILSSWNM